MSDKVDNQHAWLIEQIRNESYTLQAGNKRFELANHLGNVLAVVSAKKVQSDGVTWSAVVLSATDYFPFGMAMPGRSTDTKHRYGFNGKETDPETGIQDYGMRWYLPNIARFPSVDPITKKYPMLTPYQFASNTPLRYIDIDGLEGGDDPITREMMQGNTQLQVTNTIQVAVQVPRATWITAEQLLRINPSAPFARMQQWAATLNEIDVDLFSINTPLRKAHFLAQICQETDAFRELEESLNYRTPAAVLDAFKRGGNEYFTGAASTMPYLRAPEKLGNYVYGTGSKAVEIENTDANGNAVESDGFRYRGRGLIQLTGKGSYQRFTNWYQTHYNSDVNFVENPDLLTQPRYSLLSALWEYTVDKQGLNEAADRDDLLRITRTINGGTRGLPERKEKLAAAKDALEVNCQ